MQGKKGVTTTMFFYRSWVSRLNRQRSFARFSSASDSWKTTGRISGFELSFGEAIKAMHLRFLKKLATAALCIGLACVGYAEDTPAAKPTGQPQGSNPTAAPAADARNCAPPPQPLHRLRSQHLRSRARCRQRCPSIWKLDLSASEPERRG